MRRTAIYASVMFMLAIALLIGVIVQSSRLSEERRIEREHAARSAQLNREIEEFHLKYPGTQDSTEEAKQEFAEIFRRHAPSTSRPVSFRARPVGQ
jgi:uncharacterized membrane protein YraQ (UPF0718 family)